MTGNHIYAGMCSNNSLVSCQSREDCGTIPTVSCDSAPAKAFYLEDMQWENANANQGNVLRANRFGNGTDCAVRMDSVSSVDPNSNTGNTFVGNTYGLRTIQDQGFCGSGSAKWFQNTITENKLIDDTTQGAGSPSAGGANDRIDGVWLLRIRSATTRTGTRFPSTVLRSSTSLGISFGLWGRPRASELRATSSESSTRPIGRAASARTTAMGS